MVWCDDLEAVASATVLLYAPSTHPTFPTPPAPPAPCSRPPLTAEEEVADAVFAQAYIPRKLEEVMHYERDHARLSAGKDTGGPEWGGRGRVGGEGERGWRARGLLSCVIHC